MEDLSQIPTDQLEARLNQLEPPAHLQQDADLTTLSDDQLSERLRSVQRQKYTPQIDAAMKEVQSEGPESTPHWMMRRAVGVLHDPISGIAYGKAQQRLIDDKPTKDDFRTIAWYENRQQETAKEGVGASAAGAALSAPGHMVGFMAGGMAAKPVSAALGLGKGALGYLPRAAVQTALTPNLYAEHAIQENIKSGRDPLNPAALPGAVALGTAQMGVLQGAGALTGRALPGPGFPRSLGRVGIQGAAGVPAQAATDVATSLVGLDTGYGIFGSDNLDEAVKRAVSTAVTFAAFAGAHELPRMVVKSLKESAKAGLPPAEAAKVAEQVVEQVKATVEPGKSVQLPPEEPALPAEPGLTPAKSPVPEPPAARIDDTAKVVATPPGADLAVQTGVQPPPKAEIPKSTQELLANPALTPGQKAVLEARLNGLSLEEIAKKNSMTRERVRQIEEKALKAIGATNSIFEAEQQAKEFAAIEAKGKAEISGEEGLKVDRVVDRRSPEEKAADELASEWLREHGADPGEEGLLYSGFAGKTGRKIANWMGTNRPRDPEPMVSIDRANRLPDPQDLAEQKILASTPRGLGLAGGIGKMFDPRSRADSEVKRAIIARADMMNKAESYANIEVAKIKGEYGDIFPIEKKEMPRSDGNGTFAAEVIRLTDGTFGFKGDIIEAEMREPGSQKITDRQREWINKEWKPILEDSMRLQKNAEAGFYLEGQEPQLNDGYFHRPAYGSQAATAPRPSSKPGSKQSFMKGRDFETEQEGQEAGVRYEPDVNNIIGKFIQQTYRVVADQRLAADPALKGRVGDKTMKEGYGPNAPAFQVTRFIPGEKPGDPGTLVKQPRIYPKEIADQLTTAYGESTPTWVSTLYKGSQLFKAAQLGFDLAVGQLQLATIAAKHPKAWAKAQVGLLKDVFTTKDALQGHLKAPENYKAARELAQSGSSVGPRPDFADAANKGEIMQAVPLFGAVADRFGRATGNAFSIAKIELWKAMTHDGPVSMGLLRRKYGQNDYAALSETIDNMLGVGRVKGIGVSDAARIAENLASLGPSYYRGYFNLIAQLGQRGVGREQAVKTLATYTGALVATTAAAMLSAGMSWDEIEKRMVPGSKDYMMVDVTLPDGTVQKVGMGGIHLAFINTLGKLANADWKEGRNPLANFAHNRQGIVPATWEALVAQRDHFGDPQSIEQGAIGLALPSTAETILGRNKGSDQQRMTGAVADFLGLKNYPKGVKKYRPPKQGTP